MRETRSFFLSFVLLLAALHGQTTIAVIDFDGRGISANETATLTDRFRDELTKTHKYLVIERGKMEEVLAEQGFQQSGCVSNECVVEVGQLVGVEQMVGGSIGKVGNVYSVSARIIDVQSGNILNATTYDHSGVISGLLTSGMRQVVTGLISGTTTSIVNQTQGTGSIYITSDPDNANVWIDGIQISGTTPLMVDEQSVGDHELIVQKGDYSAQQTVTVIKDDVQKLDLKLDFGKGKLRVISNPYEADVFIDGNREGKTPLVISDLLAGSHDVRVRFDGYEEYKGSVIINRSVMEELNVDLVELAVIELFSKPDNASIFLDGKYIGNTPLKIRTETGEHTFSLRKHEYYDQDFTLKLEPNKKVTKFLELISWNKTRTDKKDSSIVFIISDPNGAEIFVDDNYLGTTPGSVHVSAGRHKFSLRQHGYYDQDFEIITKSGDEITKKYKLKPWH